MPSTSAIPSCSRRKATWGRSRPISRARSDKRLRSCRAECRSGRRLPHVLLLLWTRDTPSELPSADVRARPPRSDPAVRALFRAERRKRRKESTGAIWIWRWRQSDANASLVSRSKNRESLRFPGLKGRAKCAKLPVIAEAYEQTATKINREFCTRDQGPVQAEQGRLRSVAGNCSAPIAHGRRPRTRLFLSVGAADSASIPEPDAATPRRPWPGVKSLVKKAP
jgi:hypothetical protein